MADEQPPSCSPPGGASSRRCGRRASSRSRTPTRACARSPRSRRPHEDLDRGRGDRRPRARGRPPARAPRPGQGRVPRPRRPHRAACSCTRASTCSARSRSTGCSSLDLGDLLGADGTVFRTRRGELSLKLDDWTLLAKSLRPPPEKHHGLTDVETRYRQRELDLIANEEARELFITRAQGRHRDPPLPRRARASSRSRRRCCSRSTAARWRGRSPPTHNALDRTLYLRIATELYLKRLIVGGLERVYEIGKDFRNEGLSPKHNPEFTMLEWYEAYADYDDVAERARAAGRRASRERVGYDGEIDFTPPWKRETLAGAIAARARASTCSPTATSSRCSAAMRERRLEIPDERDVGADRRPPALQARRADSDRADVPHRLPGRAVAVRQAPPRQGRSGRAL